MGQSVRSTFFLRMTQDNAKALARIRELAEPYLESLGLSLWGLEFGASEGGHAALRVFIDGPDGVDVEDCARVSRQLGTALDVEDLVSGSYHLEVSSPGLERRFFELSQLAPYVGSELDVTLIAPVSGRKRFKGILTAIEGDALVIMCEDAPARLPWSQVAKAKAVHRFETPEDLKAKAKKKHISKRDKAAPSDEE